MLPKRISGYNRFFDLQPGVQSPKPKSDIQSAKCAWGGGFTGLGLSPKIYLSFLVASLALTVLLHIVPAYDVIAY